ncbi:nuclear transport factor 2 family protein [Burkholderia sp. BCC1998]|uniref:nuclear transport factor 2 family protein n=1 Tax=Burkholderia sp. BCC1998 TaxID=2817447 RepID=UPI002AB73393|nr:nuclear transport factor 2 family protein [Burkholderia sp. BCC1998]
MAEVLTTCGFQAVELTFRLIEEALQERRPYSFPDSRLRRFVRHVTDSLALISEHVAGQACPNRSLSGRDAFSPGLYVASSLPAHLLEEVVEAYEAAADKAGFEFGVTRQVAQLRNMLPGRAGRADRTGDDCGHRLRVTFDYVRAVAPASLCAIRETEPFGPEDHFFSTAHQITECWLNVAHVAISKSEALARHGNWVHAAGIMTLATDSLKLASQTTRLLEEMALVDYHPLRVRLRDGSGAQSKAAQGLGVAARSAAAPLWRILETEGGDVEGILRSPGENLGRYTFLRAVCSIGQEIQLFLFHHYLLVLRVLGTHTTGSLGYQVHKLAERASMPVFNEINQAHHNYVMSTNFDHGQYSGAIILKNEVDRGWSPYGKFSVGRGCAPKLMESAVKQYFAFIAARNGEGWVNLFDPTSGEMVDGGDARPFRGRKHLRVFINAMMNAFSEMRPSLSDIRFEGNKATAAWHFETVSYHGRRASFGGTEEFVFSDAGEILRARADWTPDAVSRQWRGAVTLV